MAIDIGVIISLIVGIIITVVGAIYFVIYFSSPIDKNQAWLPKILTMIGFAFFVFCCLLVPLDVANTPSQMLPMDIIWSVVTYVVAAMAFIVAPYALFFYESAHLKFVKAFFSALWQTVLIVIVIAVIIAVLFFTVGTAQIPILSLTTSWEESPSAVVEVQEENIETTLNISFFAYSCSFLALLGSIFFYVFGGVGLYAMPIDMISEWRHRPKPLNGAEYAKWHVTLRGRALKLRQYAMFLQRRLRPRERVPDSEKGMRKPTANEDPLLRGRHEKALYRSIEQGTRQLEMDYDTVEAGHGKRPYNALLMWIKLFLGILCILSATLLFVHVCLLLIPQMFGADPVFDVMGVALGAMDKAWGFLSLVFFALIAFQLSMSLLKGLAKFSFRFAFLIPLHPLKKDDTTAASFLFNVSVLLIASLGLVQFLSTCLPNYTAGTAASTLWSSVAEHARGIRYIFFYGPLAFAIIAFLSLIWSSIFQYGRIRKSERRDTKLSAGSTAMNNIMRTCQKEFEKLHGQQDDLAAATIELQ